MNKLAAMADLSDTSALRRVEIMKMMRFAALLAALMLCSSACLKKSELFCDENTPCTDPERPYCDLTGDFPASDGHGRTCIPDPFAGVDGGTPDSGGPDAAPAVPPVINFQPADLVLGQPDFETEQVRPISANTLEFPQGLASDGERLWIADHISRRVVQHDVLPVVNDQPANLALGEIDLVTGDGGTAAHLVGDVVGVAAAGDTVLVVDRSRVLVWQPYPAASGLNASLVLGQPDFVTITEQSGQTGFRFASDVCTDGVRIAVGDPQNNRLLIWSTMPSTNGAPADIVLGQVNFSQVGAAGTTTRSSLRPSGVYCDESRLVVTDGASHRVLIWNDWPSTNNQPADVVVGQPDGESGQPNAGASPSAFGLFAPGDVAVSVARDTLFVADGQSRVLVYTPIPRSDGEAAVRVLGQPDMVSIDQPAPGTTVANRFAYSVGLVATSESLFVSDTPGDRVLRFSFLP